MTLLEDGSWNLRLDDWRARGLPGSRLALAAWLAGWLAALAAAWLPVASSAGQLLAATGRPAVDRSTAAAATLPTWCLRGPFWCGAKLYGSFTYATLVTPGGKGL